MKHLLIILAAAITLTSCAIQDIPEINPETENYTVSSKGGELIIPITSTGIDNVLVSYRYDRDEWEVDPETGDRVHKDGWVKVVKIIEHYQTRDLAVWTSAVVLEIEPNTSSVEREAYITANSFQAKAKITIKQGF